MDWKTLLLIGVGAWFVAVFANKALRVLIDIRDRLTSMQNTAAMQFYAIEQIYEMSEIYQRFKATKPSEGKAFGRHPINDVDDVESSSAWSTLMTRMQNRVESVTRTKYRPRDTPPETPDPDWYFARDHHDGWIERIPKLKGWPRNPRVCWWGTDEKEPADVPLFARDDD